MLLKQFIITLILVGFSHTQQNPGEDKWEGILIVGGNNETSLCDPQFQIVNPRTNFSKIITAPATIPKLFNMAAATQDNANLYKVYITGGTNTEGEAKSDVVLFQHRHPNDLVSKVTNMLQVSFR